MGRSRLGLWLKGSQLRTQWRVNGKVIGDSRVIGVSNSLWQGANRQVNGPLGNWRKSLRTSERVNKGGIIRKRGVTTVYLCVVGMVGDSRLIWSL